MIVTKHITLEPAGGFAIENITDELEDLIQGTGMKEGSALVFYQHTTGGILLMEFEAGIMADLESMFDRIAPVNHEYLHHIRDVDFNGHAHVRSALLGASVAIPISKGTLQLGRYQQVMIVDMQTERQPRSVVIQLTGE